MKKNTLVLSVIFIINLFFTFSLSVSAYNGTYNNGTLYYDIVDGEAIITDCIDSADGSITIPNTIDGYTVTSIGGSAFYRCSKINSVTIPDSVRTINGYAFYYCTGLTSITIPNGVTSIGEEAFRWSGLTSMTIPDTVISIGKDAFSNTSWLINKNGLIYAGKVAYAYKGTMPSTINLKDDTVGIADCAFYSGNGISSNCGRLTSITIPNSIENIGEEAFKGCSGLTSITIPNSVTNIGASAFQGSGLTSIIIPDSVTSIKDNTFYGCSNLSSMVVPDSIASIGKDAFYNTSWYNNQPDGMIYVGKIAYSYKGNMNDNTEITLKEDTIGISGRAFLNQSNLTSINIPNGVTTIGEEAFKGCSGLTSIIIPNSITNIDSDAFKGCSNFQNIHINNMTSWCNIRFNNLYSNPLYYAHKLFLNDKLVTDLVIPNGVREINFAFCGCTSIKSIIIPDGVISVESFKECSNLTSVIMPNSVTNIGYAIFDQCRSLTEITIPFISTTKEEVNPRYKTLGYLFGTTQYSGSYSVTQYYSQSETAKYNLPSSLKKITITNASEIPYGAFNNCTSLREINIEEGPTIIKTDAFSGCTNLEKITIPSSIETIEDYAFSNLDNVTVYGKENSYIASYATDNSIPFVKVDDTGLEFNNVDAVVTQIDDKVIVTANIPNDDIQKNIHAALYSNNGSLIDYMIFPAEFSNNTVHFMFRKIKDLSYIKVYLWNSLEQMLPLEDAIVLSIN